MVAAVVIRRFSLAVALVTWAAAPVLARAQQTSTASAKRVPHKDPQLATIVGILVPGGGQFYAERYGKAAGVFVGTLAAVGIAVDAHHSDNTEIETAGFVAAALIWGYGWVTAARDARLFNDQMLHTTLTPFLDGRNGRFLAGLTLSTP
jgi:hypothetical protein